MLRASSRIAHSLAAACLLASAAPVHAAEQCKARIAKATGVIEVSATNVDAATLAFGDAEGAEGQGFFDPACITGTRAKRCTLADPAILAAKTPPAGCTLFLADANGSCSAWIPGCTPGTRVIRKVVTVEPSDWQALGDFVIEDSGSSGMFFVDDPAITVDSLVQVRVNANRRQALPLNATQPDGSYERMSYAVAEGELSLYYQRFTAPATTLYAPSEAVEIEYFLSSPLR